MRTDRDRISRAAEGKRRRKAIRRARKRRSANKSVVVQLVSAADVARLERRDDALRADIGSIQDDLKRFEENRSKDNYEYRTIIGQIRRKLNL